MIILLTLDERSADLVEFSEETIEMFKVCDSTREYLLRHVRDHISLW